MIRPGPAPDRRRRMLIGGAIIGLLLGIVGPVIVNASHGAWWAQFLYGAGLLICLIATAALALDWYRDVSRRARPED